MEMRLKVMFYCNILLCLCIYVSNGAPPKEVHAGTSNTRYTEQEDNLIVKELMHLVDGIKSHNVWSKLTEMHNEKWRTKSPGFPQERSLSSLRNRFWGVLIHNLPKAKVKVPESFKMKLQKPNLYKRREGTGSSKTSAGNQHNDHQEIDQELSDDEWVADMLHEFHDDTDVDKKTGYNPRFMKAEDDFIFDEISRFHDDNLNVHSTYVWNQIAANYRKKWKDRTPGFTTERSAKNLYDRFRYFLTSKHQPNTAQVPEHFMQRLINLRSDQLGTAPRHYTTQEDKFIIAELSKPSLNRLYSSSTLESLCAEHEKKHKAGISGFENARTLRSLRGRIGTMKRNGQLPNEITKKLSERERGLPSVAGISGGESSHTHENQQTDAEYDLDFRNDFSYAED